MKDGYCNQCVCTFDCDYKTHCISKSHIRMLILDTIILQDNITNLIDIKDISVVMNNSNEDQIQTEKNKKIKIEKIENGTADGDSIMLNPQKDSFGFCAFTIDKKPSFTFNIIVEEMDKFLYFGLYSHTLNDNINDEIKKFLSKPKQKCGLNMLVLSPFSFEKGEKYNGKVFKVQCNEKLAVEMKKTKRLVLKNPATKKTASVVSESVNEIQLFLLAQTKTKLIINFDS